MNPVDYVMGDENLWHTDFSVPGLIDVEWTRYYRSSIDELDDSELGARWSSPFHTRFEAQGEQLTFIDSLNRALPHRSLRHMGTITTKDGTTIAGTGRHVDYGPFTVEAQLTDAGPEAVLVQSDIRSLPLPTASIDHVAMFFTSFGYLPTDEENLEVLKEVARVVRVGGGFLLDLPDRDSVIASLIATSHRSQGDLHIDESRSITTCSAPTKIVDEMNAQKTPNARPKPKFSTLFAKPQISPEKCV